MIRFSQIMVFLCTTVLLAGCKIPEKKMPVQEHIKLSDLAAPPDINNTEGRRLKTINLDIHIFEMPAEDANVLNQIQQMLYIKQLQFNDYAAFKANSFSIGFGQIEMWDTIAKVLHDAGGKEIETVSLLLPDGETNDFTVTRLSKEQTIFYTSSDGSLEGVTVGRGRLALRIKVEKIPGSRGVCNVSAQPVFTPPITSPVPQLAEREKTNEFLFMPAGFHLKMGPGDFVMLGPQKYIGNQITLGSLFFSRPKPKPTVMMYLIICTRIID